jgi:hypothetical protein
MLGVNWRGKQRTPESVAAGGASPKQSAERQGSRDRWGLATNESQPPNDMTEAVNPEVKEQAPSGRVHPLVRHSLSRKAGWRMPANTVKVSRPGKWGNPFLVGPERTQVEAVGAFRIWLTTEGVTAGIHERKQWMLDHLHELRGKNLACWCKAGTPCHADVLLDMANSTDHPTN